MKKNKQSLIPDGIKQTSFLEKLRLPAIALAIIAIIYGGLIIRDLKSQVGDLNKQNQANIFKANELASRLDQLQNDVNVAKANNDNLAANLAQSQKQISSLQNQIAIKKVAGVSSPIVNLEPAVVTKTITQTITKEVEKNQATVTIENVGSYKVDLQAGDNAFEVLKRAASENNFAIDYEVYSFGVFVKSIGGVVPQGNQYWAFYFNGAFSQVGASDQAVVKGDSIFWQLASF